MSDDMTTPPVFNEAAVTALDVVRSLMAGTKCCIKADLRGRDDGLYGVMWIEDPSGGQVGNVLLESGPMQDCVGSRVAWHLYMEAFAKYTGATVRGEL